MKKSLAVVLLLSSSSYAQFPQLDQMDMQKMATEAQAAQKCMARIDQGALNALEQEARAFEQEISALCEQGLRDKAQEHGLAFAKSINENDTIKTVRKCSEKMTGMMANMMPQLFQEDQYEDLKSRHICD